MASRFHVLFAFLSAITMGCRYEPFRGEAGSGYKTGIALVPTVALLAVLSAAPLAYLGVDATNVSKRSK